MSENFERYPLPEYYALEEAERIKDKIKKGEAKNESEADTMITEEEDKLIAKKIESGEAIEDKDALAIVRKEYLDTEKGEKERLTNWAKHITQLWHKVNPDYIFLTISGAIPYGYLLKETWKSAYPAEELPKFYKMEPPDSCENRGNPFDYYIKERKKFLVKRIKKNNPKIIVFDEGGGYNEEISFKQIYKNGEFVDKEKGMALNSVLKSIAHILGDELHVAPIIYALKNSSGCDMMIKNISEDQNLSRSPVSKLFGVHDIHGGRSRSTDELEITDEYLEDLVKQGRFTYGGKIVTNPEQRKRAINWIKKLKNIGKEAGQELYQEIQETR